MKIQWIEYAPRGKKKERGEVLSNMYDKYGRVSFHSRSKKIGKALERIPSFSKSLSSIERRKEGITHDPPSTIPPSSP